MGKSGSKASSELSNDESAYNSLDTPPSYISSSRKASSCRMKSGRMDKNRPDDYVFFLVIVGESGVGKTSILNRFVNDTFAETVPPTEGVNFGLQSVMVDNTKIGLEIWDVSGEERTRVPTSYYKDCKGVLAVYDISNRESFLKLEKWIEDSNRLSGRNFLDTGKWLVGNKSDKDREVTVQEAQQFAKRMNMNHFEVSAKTGSHVEDLFAIIGSSFKP